MKKHFLKCRGIVDVHGKPDSQGSKTLKLQGSGESSSKSKKDKGDKCGDEEKGDKLCGSESKAGSKAASQEESQESLHHSKHLAGSSAAGSNHWHHKKSKKCDKKSHKKLHH